MLTCSIWRALPVCPCFKMVALSPQFLMQLALTLRNLFNDPTVLHSTIAVQIPQIHCNLLCETQGEQTHVPLLQTHICWYKTLHILQSLCKTRARMLHIPHFQDQVGLQVVQPAAPVMLFTSIFTSKLHFYLHQLLQTRKLELTDTAGIETKEIIPMLYF